MTGREEEGTRAGQQVTLMGVGINAFLIVCKFITGIVGNSQAMIADAVHSVSDFLTDALVLLGLRLGRKEEDPDHPFGHGRMETLSTSMVGLVLIGAAICLGIKAPIQFLRELVGPHVQLAPRSDHHLSHSPGEFDLEAARLNRRYAQMAAIVFDQHDHAAIALCDVGGCGDNQVQQSGQIEISN